MGDYVDELAVALTGDASGLIATFTKAGEQVSKIANGIGSSMSNSVAAGMIKAELAVEALKRGLEALYDSTVEQVKQSMEHIEAQTKLADRLGVTTEAMAGLQYEADLTKTSIDTVAQGMTILQRGLAEANDPANNVALALRELGISLQDLKHQTPDQQLGMVADALNRVHDQSERTRLTLELFGRGGAQMSAILREGSAGMAEAAEQADKLGLSFSRVDAAKVEAANQAFVRMREAIAGAANMIAISLAPYLEGAVNTVIDLVEKTGGWKDALKNAGAIAIQVIDAVADTVHGLVIEWNAVKVAAGYVSIAFNTVLDLLSQGVLGLAALIANVADVIIDSFKMIGDAAIVVWEEIKKHATDMVGSVEEMFAEMVDSGADAASYVNDSLAESMHQAAASIRADAHKGADAIDKELGQSLTDASNKAQDLQADYAKVFDFTRFNDLNPFGKWTQDAIAQTDAWKQDFDAELDAPLPHDAIDEWADHVSQAADAAAKHVANTMAASATGGTGGEDEQAKARRAQLQSRLGDLEDTLTKERMAENEAYEQRKADAQESFDVLQTSKAEQDAVMEKLDEEHQRKMAGINDRYQRTDYNLWQQSWKGKTQVLDNYLGQATTLMNSHNRKMFEIGKMAAYAKAIVDTAAGVASTFRDFGWYALLGPAEAVAAAGLVQIQQIASTKFDGGGSSPSTGSAGSSGMAINAQQQQASAPAQSVNIHLSGSSFSQGDVRQLIENINGALSDGAKLNVA